MKKLFIIIVVTLELPILLLLLCAIAAPYIPPDIIAFPAFAGLAFIWIFIVNLVFCFILLLLKAKFAIPGIILLLFSIYNLLHNIGFSQKHESTEGMKLLSYNCQGFYNEFERQHGKGLTDSIVLFIKNQNPDIVCLQEYRGVKNEEVESFMNKMSQTINTKDFHYQRYFIDQTNNNALCLITLSKFPIVHRHVMQLGKRRIGMFTDIVAVNDTIRIFNIHLQSTRIIQKDIDFMMTPDFQNTDNLKNIYKKLSNAYQLRAQQARLIALAIKKSPYPVIVCGDFNDTPTSFAYHQISKRLSDAFLQSGNGIEKTYNHNRLPPIRIDYILYDKNFKCNDFQIYKVPYSDHFPISAIIDKCQ
jgi:endonuclease/exonuclease/phosphatase family metal-dependent hydrolase